MLKVRRKWTACPNCASPLSPEDNFCAHCGQENHDLNVPLKKLLPEVLENMLPIGLTGVNNKFWNSIKTIFVRPGQITSDFLTGRRARYVPPMRLYIWTSLVFFLILGRLANQQLDKHKNDVGGIVRQTVTLDKLVDADTLEQRGLSDVTNVKIQYSLADSVPEKVLQSLRHATDKQIDSLLQKSKLTVSPVTRTQLKKALALLPDKPPASSSPVAVGLWPKDGQKGAAVVFSSDSARKAFVSRVEPMNEQQLDSIVNKAGGAPGGINRFLLQKGSRLLRFNSVGEAMQSLTPIFLKNLSGVMFIMMPFVAFLLWLFYVRRKQYRRHYYEHLIFSVHTHTALFLFFSLGLLVVALLAENARSYHVMNWLGWGCWLYFLFALKHVYRQSWLRTGVKWMLISFVYFITVSLFMMGAIIVGALAI